MARTLVVVVPSIHDRAEPWQPLLERLEQLPGYEEPACRWEVLSHGARWHRPGRAEQAGARIAGLIHQRWLADGGYDKVVLVGHSLGGLLVRYAYLSALGAFNPDERRNWASAVERVVLFASLNRGVEVSFRRRWWLPFVAWLTRVLPVTRRWLAHDLLRGSEFIANLRIAWIREINALDRPPVMVQFLGSSDNLVSVEDSRDVDRFPTGTQQQIPDGTHADLIRLDTAPDPEARFRLIADAFERARPESVGQVGDPTQRVVIVLHGIRANNDTWARDLEGYIERQWPGTEVIAATYGRFSARKFFFPVTRRKFLGWMQDTYAERLAANPRATFHFIGHSNGTYLLGHSLRRIPSMRFERVLLAGSVLPSDYPWQDRIRQHQVRGVRNDRAAKDVPVGFLCAGLRGLGMRDVGTGGVSGFYWEDPAKTEVYYYDGGHSKALDEVNLPLLANYVMEGNVDRSPQLLPTPSPRFSLLSRAAPLLFLTLALCLITGFVAFGVMGPWPLAVNLGAFLAALFAVFLVLDLV